MLPVHSAASLQPPGVASGPAGGNLAMRTVLFAAAFLSLFSSGSRADDVVGPPLWKGAGIPGLKVGGSGLRWALVVCSRGQQYRVGIDARSGRLLENVAHGSKPAEVIAVAGRGWQVTPARTSPTSPQ